MAKLIFGMNQTLDGYVDHDRFNPHPDVELFQHFIDRVDAISGSVYGRVMYGLMRYWDEDDPAWGQPEHDFAAAWRKQPKWVVSSTLKEVGPNATLVDDGDVDGLVRRLKRDLPGQMECAGPHLASALTELGLIDEYQIYLHPEVIGSGVPFFAKARPQLRLVANEPIGHVIRLTYVPA